MNLILYTLLGLYCSWIVSRHDQSQGKGEPVGNRPESFDTDPSWDGFRNRLVPTSAPITRQDFGYSTTNHAHPGDPKPGEIGGYVKHSLTPTWYAKKIPTPHP